MFFIFRELGDPFRHHFAKRPTGIMFMMPFVGHDMGQEPVQFRRVVYQLFEQAAQVPSIQHVADIEDDRIDFGNGSIPYQQVAISPGVP